MSHKPVVVITEGGPHIWAIANALNDAHDNVVIVLETPQSKRDLLTKRARKQGWVSVLGQLGTMVLVRLGKRFTSARIDRLVAEEKLETALRPNQQIVHVASADSRELIAALGDIDPGVVLLAGCRMLSKATLDAIACPVLNYHAGITPKYRGMNGGYWALAAGDPENFGTTVHMVDAGVDTGSVLYQARGKPGAGDNLASYALRQAAFSREICVRAVDDALAGRLVPVDPKLPSRQWFHPTIWQYLSTGVRKGVW